ncbi:MAG: hypothetical protein EXR75_02565 [Myxococcales bacterium]|nr:hypothetical protein [Myxococcales bacterium]
MRPRLAGTLLVWTALAGCGARSAIRGDRGDDSEAAVSASGSGGHVASGPSSQTHTSSTTGGGGAGGTLACTQLLATGALTKLPSLPAHYTDNPRIHLLADGDLAVIHRAYVDGALKLASTRVQWVDDWPPVTTVAFLLDMTSTSFAVSRNADEKSVAILTRAKASTGLSFGLADPMSGGWSPLFNADASADRALVVDAGVQQHFVAMEAPGAFTPSPSYQLRVGLKTPLVEDGYWGPLDVACKATPFAASAVATSKNWLFAHTGAQLTSCQDKVPPDASALISIKRVAPGSLLAAATLQVATSPMQLALLPRADGAWLLYLESPETMTAVRLDAFGQVELGPLAVAASAGAEYAFAADRLDDGFIFAMRDDPAGNPPDLRLVVADANAALIAEAWLVDPPPIVTAPQLVFDPVTRQALVVFAGIDASGGPVLYAARFACD